MNKIEFMEELTVQLSQIDPQERADAIAFYNEYFDEAGAENEQNVIEELGSPAQVAAQIKADAAVKEIRSETPPVKKGISAIWVVILGILALPVAFPLILIAGLLAFALLAVVAALIFTFIVVIAAFLFAGIMVIAAGIGVLFIVPAVGIFYLGCGLAVIGISIVAAALAVIIVQAVINGLLKLLNYIRVNIQKKHVEKTANSKGDESDE